MRFWNNLLQVRTFKRVKNGKLNNKCFCFSHELNDTNEPLVLFYPGFKVMLRDINLCLYCWNSFVCWCCIHLLHIRIKRQKRHPQRRKGTNTADSQKNERTDVITYVYSDKLLSCTRKCLIKVYNDQTTPRVKFYETKNNVSCDMIIPVYILDMLKVTNRCTKYNTISVLYMYNKRKKYIEENHNPPPGS